MRTSAIRRAQRGEHFLAAFDTSSQELIEQSLQFLKTGLLEKDEDILLVTDELPKDTIREKIAKEWNLSDVKPLENEGRITLMTFDEAHIKEEEGRAAAAAVKFDMLKIRVIVTKLSQKSLADGRNGLRAVADANTFFRWNMIQELITWEPSSQKQFDLPVTALCVYTSDNIKQFDNDAVQVIQKQHNRMRVI